MSGPPHRTLAVAALVMVFLSLAACGERTATATPAADPNATTSPDANITTGANASIGQAAATSTTTGSAAPAPTTSPEATASSKPTPTPAPSLVAVPSFDLDGLTDHLASVDSYRTSFVVDGVEQYASVVILKPKIRRRVTFIQGGESTTIVVIGDQSWVKSGAATTFEAVPQELSEAMLAAFDPSVIIGDFAQADWGRSALDLGAEEKNGVPTHHYRVDPSSLVGAAASMAPGSSINVWIADAGYLVAWESTGFAGRQNVLIHVTNVDDPANVVEAPS